MKRIAILVVAVAALVACGGKDKPASTTPEPAGKGEHEKLTPELAAFHDILAPRWHSPAGPDRMQTTCAAIPDFQAKAEAIKAAPAPEGVEAAKWTDAGANLHTTVGTLATQCKGTDQPAFDNAFAAVHTAFHQSMELVAGVHEHGGGHGGEHGAKPH